jgi:hypothetical protein
MTITRYAEIIVPHPEGEFRDDPSWCSCGLPFLTQYVAYSTQHNASKMILFILR